MLEFIRSLEWDSNFFGIPTARLELPDGYTLTGSDLETLFRQPFELYYYQTPAGTVNWSGLNRYFDIVLGDTRLLFVKSGLFSGEQHPAIRSFGPSEPYSELVPLALESASYSRYKKDSHFPADAYLNLYTEWIKKSVNRTLAEEVLVYYAEDFPAGMLTLAQKNDRADIGIVAVDPAFRGKGIAKAMLQAADNWAFKHGFDSIQLITQQENAPACSLYRNWGYSVYSTEYLYHIWKIK